MLRASTARCLCKGAAMLWLISLLAAPAQADFFRQQQFRRGDANGDGTVNIADVLFILNSLFSGGDTGSCREAADVNDDGSGDISDGIYLLGYLFGGLATPPHPGPEVCGTVSEGVDLGCLRYDTCPNDADLIFHVLNRITFGPTEELLERIQTREDLIVYIEEQLAPPAKYDPAIHEPELFERTEELDIGFDPEGTPRGQTERAKGLLIRSAIHSRWQLLHVLAHFWNNHFHTEIDGIRDNFFSAFQRGGNAGEGADEIFDVVDTDNSETISEAEWVVFREQYPTVEPYSFFARFTNDGAFTREEFVGTSIVRWKYSNVHDQFGVSAELELREYNFFRRNAFGSFSALLKGSAQSLAMLAYLNGFENTARAPNENYGREYVELFSVGVDHMYTQRDIEQLSRVLTGWTLGWVEKAPYDPDDLLFTGHPGAQDYPLNRNNGRARPWRFPTQEFWEDDVYTWAFVIPAAVVHDWGRKDLFSPRFGGVDSLGNPLSPSDAVSIPERTTGFSPEAALEEFDIVHERIVGFRDTAKFISSKLIQLFVTDDLAALAKTRPMPADLRARFDSIDADSSGTIEPDEWAAPVPLSLPNGRPEEIFERLDVDGDGRITPLEYQEPDLLLDAMEAWRASGGQISDVVRSILLSEEFLSSKFRAAKVKTPFEVVVSTVRALNGQIPANRIANVAAELTFAGQELFSFADPTGESELATDWMHTIGLLERLKFVNRAANPATGAESRVSWDMVGFLRRWTLDSNERVADFFTLLLLGGDVLHEQRELALEAAEASSTTRRVQALVAFLLSLPRFQKQ